MNVKKPDIFQPGEKFGGYVIEKLLGKGGLGAVYLARHEMLDTLFAIKVLYPDVANQNDNYRKRFLREAKLATRVRHPNLVAVHDCGYDERRRLYYLVMDFVPGGSLRDALAFNGRLEPDRAVKIVLQVIGALQAARPLHLVHRDLKPENIMLQPDGVVKLVDFGIAKVEGLGDSLRTTTDTIFGTPNYISPEQAMSATDVDERADIYSLGVVFFELVSGSCPYPGNNAAKILAQLMSDDPTPDIRDFKPDISPMLAVLIRRMCMKDRNRRIASFEELIREFSKLGYDLPTVSAVPNPGGSEVNAETDELMAKVVRGQMPEYNPTLSFETKDEEIQQFVSKLKQRRRRKVYAFYAAVVAMVLLTILLLVTM